LIGWLGWLGLLAFIGWVVWRWDALQTPFNRNTWLVIGGLFILVPLTSLFLGLRFPAGAALPLPGVPEEPRGPALMLLSALPWVFAGGILGPLAAAGLGFAAGLLRFLWDTHSVFTPLEFALLAALFSLMARQRYRTPIFKALRQPLVSAFVLIFVFAFIFIVDNFLAVPGSLVARLDYAITRVGPMALALGGELLIAGVFAQVLSVAFPTLWGRKTLLEPSPVERSLEARFVFGAGTLLFILLMALLIGDWLVAGSAARQLLHERLTDTARNASESVPFFLETGQNFAQQIAADPALLSNSPQEIERALNAEIRLAPFFDQLIVLNQDGSVAAAYPGGQPAGELILFPEETSAIRLAGSGVLNQVYTIPPKGVGQAARVSFVSVILDAALNPGRVLIARVDLAANPLAQPILASLDAMTSLGGAGLLLDENGRILYHPSALVVMTDYRGQRGSDPLFYDGAASDGTRSLIYYQPVTGHSWAVVLTVPAQKAQQIALNIAAPLSLMILLLGLVALIAVRIGLRVITVSLQNLATEAVRIAEGDLNRPLKVDGVDEVGQLRRSFEGMRSSLQARLGELNLLLRVSQSGASLETRLAVQPVLEAVLATGASAVFVSLTPATVPQEGRPRLFTLGPFQEAYAPLDEQILALMQRYDKPLVLPYVSRSRLLEFSDQRRTPVSLIAVALRDEKRYYGVLWATYDQMRTFSDSDTRFVTTLAGQAALAAANTYLFVSAEVGRQRLRSILDSTPDPVLVTDSDNNLLLVNPAASQVLGAHVSHSEGQPIERVIAHKALLDILKINSDDKLSAEITLDTRTYFATASPVMAEGELVGRVCILRDVTYFKELDMMKSEFVNTVSHDLRSPLTLMRGYATMLEMVGALNEQQHVYAGKIISGVENMTRLVNDLLDLGRIEVGVGLQLEIVPLFDLVERVTTPLQAQAAQKNIELTVKLPEGRAPLIEADPTLLQQVMYNLVENAIKYTPADGKVTVRLKVPGDTMQFEVQDNGIGITPIDQARLFEKFYRGSQREARQEKGTGLGLAIVKSIVERHSGKVWLDSEVGKGSTFFVLMPLRQAKQNKESAA